MSDSSARMRIISLLDEGSFVEIGADVTARCTSFNMQAQKTPSDGVITGYGTIHCKAVYVYSQNAAVLGGTIGEMHAKKIVKLYELALKTGAPVIGFLDCAGIRLQETTDALNALGEVYACQVKASGVIPQITGIFGICGGGLSVVPGLTDFTFMESENAKLFANSPAVLTSRDAQETATAAFQEGRAGNVHGTGTEQEIIDRIRTLAEFLPGNCEDKFSEECTDDLNRLCSEIEDYAGDAAGILSMIADENRFEEMSPEYAKEMVTGFLHLNGSTVGAVANRSLVWNDENREYETLTGRLSASGCRKAAEFIRFCDAFGIPVLTMTDVSGLETGLEEEISLSHSMANLAYAYGSASVPMVNVITGKAWGSAYALMNSKALGADLVFAWPESSIGMMNAESAVRIIYADEISTSEDAGMLIRKRAAEYEKLQSGPQAAASGGYVDAVIQPSETRKHVIAAFEMLYSKRAASLIKKHGTV